MFFQLCNYGNSGARGVCCAPPKPEPYAYGHCEPVGTICVNKGACASPISGAYGPVNNVSASFKFKICVCSNYYRISLAIVFSIILKHFLLKCCSLTFCQTF